MKAEPPVGAFFSNPLAWECDPRNLGFPQQPGPARPSTGVKLDDLPPMDDDPTSAFKGGAGKQELDYSMLWGGGGAPSGGQDLPFPWLVDASREPPALLELQKDPKL